MNVFGDVEEIARRAKENLKTAERSKARLKSLEEFMFDMVCAVWTFLKSKNKTKSISLAIVKGMFLAAFIAISKTWKMQAACVKLNEVLVLG